MENLNIAVAYAQIIGTAVTVLTLLLAVYLASSARHEASEAKIKAATQAAIARKAVAQQARVLSFGFRILANAITNGAPPANVADGILGLEILAKEIEADYYAS